MEDHANLNTILDLSVSKCEAARIEEHQDKCVVEVERPSSSTNFNESPSSPEYNSNVISSSLTVPYKIPRPFKAYPKDPLAVVSSLTIFLSGTYSSEEYMDFRSKMLAEVQVNYTNKNMRRHTYRASSTYEDPCYLEKRRKNNEAAKRSRDARRAKEDEIAVRCAFLEQKNWKLSCEVATLKSELERLRADTNDNNNNKNNNSVHQ